jgi:hypothetical protein
MNSSIRKIQLAILAMTLVLFAGCATQPNPNDSLLWEGMDDTNAPAVPPK